MAPWWRGHTTDHIYERCPALQAGMPELARHNLHEPVTRFLLYPEEGDVCGWCLRVWRAHRKNIDAKLPRM